MKQANSSFVGLEKAAAIAGVSYGTIRRRILDGQLKVYQDGRDRRCRLVSIEELNELFAVKELEVNDAAVA